MPAIRPERKAAIAAGEPTYIPAKPCQNGHIGPRRTKTAKCIQCDAARHHRWLNARPGLEAEWARKRRAKDPTGHRAEAKRWYHKNKDAAKVIAKRWRINNPERLQAMQRVYIRQRKAREANAEGRYTVEDIERLYTLQKSRCAICKCPEKKGRKLHVDHIVAVIRGGSNWPRNLQLLCAPCNQSKGAKDAIDWAKEHGRLL